MIKPEDDPSWPVCSHGAKHWCEEVAEVMRSHKDLMHIGATSLCVPYLPAQNLFAECRIGDEVNPDRMPGVHRLYVIKNVPLVPSPNDREEIELTLWSQGEGRASICLTVRDWVRGLAGNGHLECAFTTHGYREVAKLLKFNEAQWEINDFYCATESACWYCYRTAQQVGGVGSLMDPLDDNQTPSQRHIRQRLGRP